MSNDVMKSVIPGVFATAEQAEAAIGALRELGFDNFVTAAAVEVTEFPELGARYHVMGVPRTMIDEFVSVEGALPESALLGKLIDAQSKPPSWPASGQRPAS